MEAIALFAGLGAAAGVAVSTSLQHQAVGQTPSNLGGPGRVVLHLSRRPRWLAAQVLSLASFALHSLALTVGALATVQPVVVSGIALAVPVRAALGHRLPDVRELGAVVVTAAGLAVFLQAVNPQIGADVAPARTGLPAPGLTAGGFALAALAEILASRRLTGQRQATMYGAGAGVLFGVDAGLLKITMLQLHDHGMGGLLWGWWPWLLVAAGVAGTAMNQRAYRAGTLSASMPVLNIVDVLVGLVFGAVVFGELPAHSVGAGIWQCLGIGGIALGLQSLAWIPDLARAGQHDSASRARGER